MKKIFFSILAVAALSTTAVIAGGKSDTKKGQANTACQKDCSKTTDCEQGADCPQMTGCTCGK